MKTTGAAPSRSGAGADLWSPSFDDLKHYPHFDAPLKISEIRSIVNDPDRVAKNAFFPLIEYEKKWQPFRTPKNARKPDTKTRKIRYAARRDAYIYAKYRRILSPIYEDKLINLGISDVSIAYRKIKGASGNGKCNIDFAKDAFDFISACEKCYVITLDISKFLESLDHNRIEKIWCELLNVHSLPKDHAAVFKSITEYRWVDREELYERLGYFGIKTAKNGTQRRGFLTPFSEMPKQLCSPKKFRVHVAGKGSHPSIISANPNSFGIPQGTPISDLIANTYMMEFDCFIRQTAEKYRGFACRYSDDILLVVQAASDGEAHFIEKAVRTEISRFGNQMVIKEEKSSIHRFDSSGHFHSCTSISGSGKNGLEYLGFRFDGKNVYLRDSTVPNLKRKMTFSARVRAQKHKKRYSSRSRQELISSFNFDDLFQSFMRVQDFDESTSVKNWTFWTYAKRASEVFGSRGKKILRQIRHLKSDGQRVVEKNL